MNRNYYAKKTGDYNHLHIVYGNRAKALYELGRKKESLEWLQQKLILCEQIHHFDGQQMALSNLFVYYFSEGDSDKALDCCEKRIDLCLKHKARIPLAESYYQYAQILKKCGKISEAENTLRQVQLLT